MRYRDINNTIKGFVFELDNVIFPEKDYLLQIYYLFSNFIEYSEGSPPAADLVAFFKTAFEHHGDEGIFDRVKEAFGIDEKYRENFDRLYVTARLPLKLLMYKPVLQLMQDIVADGKKLYIVTNGLPEVQLNKLRQIEWNGLGENIKVFYTSEIKPKPQPDVLTYILQEDNLKAAELLVVGSTETDRKFAANSQANYIDVEEIT